MKPAEKRAHVREHAQALGIFCTDEAVGKLIRYQELMEDWNTRLNLTGDASFTALLDHHLMDSLAMLTVAGLLPAGTSVIDVGSGAGFPGIPLAIVRPDIKITLLDSLKKRVGFLETAIGTLELSNASAVHARAEDAARETGYRERYDLAAARAVAVLPVLLELLLPFVRVGGKSVCYKGPSVENEVTAGGAAAGILGGSPPVVTPVVLPYLPELRHRLVISEKLRPTPALYPRKAGMPAKKTLGE